MSKVYTKSQISAHYDSYAVAYQRRHYAESRLYSPLAWRQAYIEEMIARCASQAQIKQILDVGCGPGELLAVLAKQGFEVSGIDISEEMVGQARRAVSQASPEAAERISVGDIEALGFENDSFDLTVVSGVLEYQPGDEKSLSELARVTRVGGYLIINVTNQLGYLRWFDTAFRGMKRTPWTRSILTFIKQGIFRRGPVTDIPQRRLHVPSRFDAELARHGFRVEQRQYFHFSLLPVPFDAVFPGICNRVGVSLERIGTSSAAKFLAGGYLVTAKLERKG